MQDNIKQWYVDTYPTDELGQEIDSNASFSELWDKDYIPFIYGYLDVHDSIVRERVFAELARRQGVPYNDIYEQWLNETARYED